MCVGGKGSSRCQAERRLLDGEHEEKGGRESKCHVLPQLNSEQKPGCCFLSKTAEFSLGRETSVCVCVEERKERRPAKKLTSRSLHSDDLRLDVDLDVLWNFQLPCVINLSHGCGAPLTLKVISSFRDFALHRFSLFFSLFLSLLFSSSLFFFFFFSLLLLLLLLLLLFFSFFFLPSLTFPKCISRTNPQLERHFHFILQPERRRRRLSRRSSGNFQKWKFPF